MPSRRRLLWPLAAASTFVLLTPALSFAHCTLDKSSVPADSDADLSVRAPVEHTNGTYNGKIIVGVPAGFSRTTCDPKRGWTCTVTPDATNGRSAVITWTRESGVDAIDILAFHTHSPKVSGSYPFKIDEVYTDGATEHWEGPAGSAKPAPVLEVTGGGTAPVANTAAPTAHSTTAAPTSPGRPSTSKAAKRPSPTSRRATATATTSPAGAGGPAPSADPSVSVAPPSAVGSTDAATGAAPSSAAAAPEADPSPEVVLAAPVAGATSGGHSYGLAFAAGGILLAVGAAGVGVRQRRRG